MLIPSIDLQNGRIVQLVQGSRLALESADVGAWIARFATFPIVQLIDLDAAMGKGHNDGLVRRIAAALPVRVGGGVRSVERAQELLGAGARAVIVGSALFRASTDDEPVRLGSTPTRQQGPEARQRWIDLDFAARMAAAVGVERLIGAVDARAGHVAIHGWTTMLPLSAVDAVRALEPYCGGFLYTHVDLEGMMQGTDMAAIRAVSSATSRRVTAAGGITTRDEIDALDALGIDAVVGMAIYTGTLEID